MRSNIKSIVLAALVVFSFGACSEQSQSPMQVGTNVWPGYEPVYLARDLGYYGDNHIHLNQFQSATEAIRAFRNGAIDVVALTLDEALLLIQDGIEVKIFLVADISDGGDVIMGKPNMKSGADLKGRRVGVESSALGAYVLARALEINRVPVEDVELVHMTADESEQAYVSGSVDAVVTFEPYRSRLLRAGAKEVFTSREMPNEIVDVLVVRKAYAKENPEKLRLLSETWLKAVSFIHDEPQKAAEMIGQRLGLSADEALSSFKGLILPNAVKNMELLANKTATSLNNKVQKLQTVLVRHGLLKNRLSLHGIFTDTFIR